MGSGQSNPDGSPKTIYDHINYHIGNISNLAGGVTAAVGSAKKALGSFSSTAGLGAGGSGEYGGGFFDGGAAENDKKPLASIIAYRQSKSHESKQLLAEKLIQALKIAGVTVRENGDIADIAKAIMEKLPNPHKGQSYKVESESQKNVLKALVKGLNDSFSPGASADLKFIPTTYGLEDIARQAMELVYSMTTGVHDEFLTVQASVVNALHNVKVLRKLMDSAHEEVVSQANHLMANPDRNTSNYTSYQEIYKRIAKECDRQITMLSNMLDSTMGPEMNVMQQLADETSADYKYIKKYVIGNNSSLDLKTAASVMAHLVHGIATTAVMITQADKTFAELGGQMMNLKGATEEAVDAAIDELIRKDPSNAAKYIRWKGIIKMYNAEHEIRNDTKMRGSDMRNNDSNIRVRVGAADLFEERKSKYATNYKKSTSEKRIIFSDYISKSSALYAKLLAAVDAIGPRIGGEIPISDKLLDLREAFVSLADEQNGLGGGSLEKALIGFDLEIAGRQSRDAFMNKLRLVKTVLEQVVGMSVYSGVRQYFDPMVSAVSSMVEQADMYYDIVKQKYGSKEGGADGDDDYQLPEVARSAHDLKKSVNSFVYYMYVAKVRENLKQTHSEVESYGEKYTQLLGEAVACRFQDIKKAYDKQTEDIKIAFENANILNDSKTEDAKKVGDTVEHAYYANIQKSKEACNKYSKKQYECKKNFYLSLQAVDMYLKEFTEGVTANPEDIADIKQMLTGVDLIGPWYDDKTGNHLAHGFDAFGNNVRTQNDRPLHIWVDTGVRAAIGYNETKVGPDNALGGGGVGPYGPTQSKAGYIVGDYDFSGFVDKDELGTNHYYSRLANSARHIGSPYNVAGTAPNTFNIMRADDRKMAEIAVDQFSRTYDNFQALKNIINAIVRMGDKFGNKELRNSVFMSPSEIFKNLMSYLKCSATTFTFTPNTAAGVIAGTASDRVNRGFLKIPTATLHVGTVATGSTEFELEDWYFQMIVKAMATKILTVIGVYDLFNRPGPVYDLTPTRMIIGGAMDRPEVLPEAAELYFRLVRLAEYYRISAFTNMNNEKQIGLVPDVGGVFAGFVKLMWMKFGNTTVSQGNYSDSELQQIVAEINSIYHHFKGESEHSVTSKACNEFVMEINRRYGIVKRTDFESFYKMVRETNNLGSSRDEFNNYAILPGEGELRAKRPAPSDMYLSGLGKDPISLTIQCETKLDEAAGGANTYYDMLKTFRNDLAKSFENARGNNPSDYNKFVNVSYSVRIKQAADKMRKESENERYDTVGQLIRGSNGLASTDLARDYFFHETVVTGLSALTATIRMFEHIIARVDVMNGLPNGANKTVKTLHAAAGGGGGVATAVGRLRDIIILVNGLNNSFGNKITVRFPQNNSSQLSVDFTDLGNHLESLSESVKYFMNLMRQIMPSDIIKKYEGAAGTVGTYRWVESNLSQLIRGRNNRYTDAMDINPQDGAKLEKLSADIDIIYTSLVHTYNNNLVDFRNLIWFDGTLNGYDAAGAFTAAGPDLVPLTDSDSGLDFLIADKSPQRSAGSNAKPNRSYFNQIQRIWNGNEINDNKGMMTLFNQLLSMYLQQFYDPSSGKIYRGLIENFASGSFNQAITDTRTTHVFTDLYASGVVSDPIAPIFTRLSTVTYTSQMSNNAVLALRAVTTVAAVNQTNVYGRAIAIRALAAGQPTIDAIARVESNRVAGLVDTALNADVVNATTIAQSVVTQAVIAAAVAADPDVAGSAVAADAAVAAGGFNGAGVVAGDAGAAAAGVTNNATRLTAFTAALTIIKAASVAAAVANGGTNTETDVIAAINAASNAASAGVLRVIVGAAAAAGANAGCNVSLNVTLANDFAQARAAVNAVFANIGLAEAAFRNNLAFGNAITGITPIETQLANAVEYPQAVAAGVGVVVGADEPIAVLVAVAATVANAVANADRARAAILIVAGAELDAVNAANAAYTTFINNVLEISGTAVVNALAANNNNSSKAAMDVVLVGADIRNAMLLAAANSLLQSNNQPTVFSLQAAQNAVGRSDLERITRNKKLLEVRQAADTINAPGAQVSQNAVAPGSPSIAIGQLDTQVSLQSNDPPTNVLLQSLALILQRLMTDQSREGASDHLISTLSEVPMFVRERMRAYLPVFNKMFNMVQQQGEFLKQLMEQTDLVIGAVVDPKADRVTRSNMTTCINKIIDGCYTLANSASDVYRELADEPKFLQTQENSIRDYQSRYGKLPLMPLSSSLNYLNIAQNNPGTSLVPTHTLGTPDFKMMYGVRGLFTDAVWKSTSAPGVQHALDNFRSSSNISVDDAKYDKFAGNMVGTVRALVDLRYYSSILCFTNVNNNVGNLGNIVFCPADMTVAVVPPATQILAYQFDRNVTNTNVLTLTESSSQAAQMQLITQHIGALFGAVNNADDRELERMYNIVDMNIIPVNVHALMRGMPLAPLYNYTYTFEENARLALGITAAAALAAHEPTTAREWFFKILENPYYDVVADAGRALRQEFDSGVVNQINAIPHPTVYATVAQRAQVVAVARTVDEFVARTWVDPHNSDPAAAAIKALVHNVAAPINDADLAIIIRNTYRLAIQAGAYSTPAAPAAPAEPNAAAGRVIAGVLGANAELIALFNSQAYETNGVGAANAASAANTRTLVIDIATRVAVGLILARNLNMNKLHPVQITAINTTLARLLVRAPANNRTVANNATVTYANRLLVAALNQDTEASARAAVTALVAAGAAGANSPLGVEVLAVGAGIAAGIPAADGRNDHNARVIDVLAEIGILTALVNNMDTSVRLNRYSLDRHSTNDRTLASLMHGDETLLMGRPKFISDQLFHKVLPTLNSAGEMTYYENGQLVPIPAANAAVNARDVFQARFNTRIVRNLMHCTNVQRVLRLRLNQELTSYRDVLVNSESITNPSVTEFGNLRWTDMRLGPGTDNRRMDPRNEDARSRTYNSEDTVGIPR